MDGQGACLVSGKKNDWGCMRLTPLKQCKGSNNEKAEIYPPKILLLKTLLSAIAASVSMSFYGEQEKVHWR